MPATIGLRVVRREVGQVLGAVEHEHDECHYEVGTVDMLAYLSPDVLERLVTQREPAELSLGDLVVVAGLPWHEQAGEVFAQGGP